MANATIVSRVYGNFRGVDFRGAETSLDRSPDCLNVWKNYRGTNGIQTRPKEELFESFEETVYGIFFYKNETIVHSGSTLYKVVV